MNMPDHIEGGRHRQPEKYIRSNPRLGWPASHRRRRGELSLLLLCGGLLAACGPDTGGRLAIEGSVTLDGKPLPTGHHSV